MSAKLLWRNWWSAGRLRATTLRPRGVAPPPFFFLSFFLFYPISWYATDLLLWSEKMFCLSLEQPNKLSIAMSLITIRNSIFDIGQSRHYSSTLVTVGLSFCPLQIPMSYEQGICRQPRVCCHKDNEGKMSFIVSIETKDIMTDNTNCILYKLWWSVQNNSVDNNKYIELE